MPRSSTADQWRRWLHSGCGDLTGRSDGPPLPPPAGLIDALDEAATRLADASRSIGSAVEVDPLAELAVRRHTHGHRRRGDISCGGGTRLLECTDGWVAVTLARDDDRTLVAALVEHEIQPHRAWNEVTSWCSQSTVARVEERAVMLGLAVGAVGTASPDSAITRRWRTRTAQPPGGTVVDLSSLWAGPLCAALLGRAGLDVVKVESDTRPDGSRAGPAAFFDHVNGAKRSVTLALSTTAGRDALRAIIEQADVVVEASRPRALAQLGIHRDELERGPRVWVRITGHGTDGDAAQRIGFGDDTAAAGGLLVDDDTGPLFCADAVADPVVGILGAAAALDALRAGHVDQCADIDIAMAGAAARCTVGGDWFN